LIACPLTAPSLHLLHLHLPPLQSRALNRDCPVCESLRRETLHQHISAWRGGGLLVDQVGEVADRVAKVEGYHYPPTGEGADGNLDDLSRLVDDGGGCKGGWERERERAAFTKWCEKSGFGSVLCLKSLVGDAHSPPSPNDRVAPLAPPPRPPPPASHLH
jgi:hypothetical protein